MFINKLKERNPELINSVFQLHDQGAILPDSYIIDMDRLLINARLILEAANTKNVKLYFMLKQIGRNPYIARKLMELGYAGAVVVDSEEALVMMKHNIPLGNVGHLVQIPKQLIDKVVSYGSDVITVYSFEKLLEINQSAKKYNKVQNILVKVADDDDLFYSGQISGIKLENLTQFLEEAKNLKNISIVGATAFPCYLFDSKNDSFYQTPNFSTVIKATNMIKDAGYKIEQTNIPSTTCVASINMMDDKLPHKVGEPGHGLTGTTPAHAYQDLEEIPAVCYYSEISHHYNNNSYCYGGGFYRRSHVKNGLVLVDNEVKDVLVEPVDLDSIDYHFEIKGLYPISAPVIMAFRFQMFVTRSKVVLVEGISKNNPSVIGIYDGLGKKI